jgi:hypothetical protein
LEARVEAELAHRITLRCNAEIEFLYFVAVTG